ncbi:MAG TPA: DNA topoisomerase IV subunit A [Candidatus Xenobia bacterium]|jgi:topoisomerase-4 subunit A
MSNQLDLFDEQKTPPTDTSGEDVFSAIEHALKDLDEWELGSGDETLDDAEAPPAAGPPSDGGGGGRQEPPPLPPLPSGGDSLPLGLYAERAYLEYAVSVVKGRALPDVCDGQKPVQRRILYAMREMGLGPTAKPVKSARVIGDVLGKYHPHGDTAAYDAMVRLAQDFTMRYPLVDGHGNFGSRDGDSPAAMRYTEARLTAVAGLLLDEIDRGTVEFIPNYDGSQQEPALLPARLPMVLLNGASGIAVGMATEIPPHNLREVGEAAIAMLARRDMTTSDLMRYIKGPDFPGGGQIISSASDILAAYESGRGSLKMRARWKIEERARGQWQVVVTELPAGTSTQKVLEEIEELSNPKVKVGKKSLTQEQNQLKQYVLSLLDATRDESGKEHAVRLVLEPKTSKVDKTEFMNTLLANTSLESSAPLNLVMIGRDGRPRQKSLRDIVAEWVDFRIETVRRRTAHRLEHVLDRIHVLEGRHIVYLNVDAVVRTIRESDDPKADLMEAFTLTERQAEDILEMRLRQLARLEGFKIEQDLADFRQERRDLQHLLDDQDALEALVSTEIKADVAKFGDARRTLIEETERASVALTVVDEPMTVIMSDKGWVRSRTGHSVDVNALNFKEGDRLAAHLECRSVDSVIFLGTDGRAYTVPMAQIPGGRGDGVPISTLVEVQPKTRVVHMLVARAEQGYLVATSGGYGFVCHAGDMIGQKRAGKAFVSVEEGEALLRPLPVPETPETWVATLADNGRVLVFPLGEVKQLAGGGKGVVLMDLEDKEKLLDVTVAQHGVVVHGVYRNKPSTETVRGEEWTALQGRRARRGKDVAGKMKVARLEPLT